MSQPEKHDDIALKAGANADSDHEVHKHIDSHVLDLYDVYSYRHAAAIMKTSFPKELKEIEEALLNFQITLEDIAMPGGNESVIPKQFSSALRPHDWYETRVQGDLVIRVYEQSEEILANGKLKKHKMAQKPEVTVENYIDGHKIDYVKGRVALDMEWNSKDQTYDRAYMLSECFMNVELLALLP